MNRLMKHLTGLSPPVSREVVVPLIRQTRNDPGEPRVDIKPKPSKEPKNGIRKRGGK